ncbi:MAG: hypothetical protein MZV64_45435 [Ignavibacteriales bacterium]|nr:hypothetical protein [Ignavibacteriales bacterium]
MNIIKVALDLIPCTTQTLAKGPQQNVKGIAPKYLVNEVKVHTYGMLMEMNTSIIIMAIGPLSLGYAYDKVDEAIKEQLKRWNYFSLMHPLEVEVAELIHKIIPNAESIRYSKVGADVTSAAVRVARALYKKR